MAKKERGVMKVSRYNETSCGHDDCVNNDHIDVDDVIVSGMEIDEICYVGWLKATGIKIEPNKSVKIKVTEVK